MSLGAPGEIWGSRWKGPGGAIVPDWPGVPGSVGGGGALSGGRRARGPCPGAPGESPTEAPGGAVRDREPFLGLPAAVQGCGAGTGLVPGLGTPDWLRLQPGRVPSPGAAGGRATPKPGITLGAPSRAGMELEQAAPCRQHRAGRPGDIALQAALCRQAPRCPRRPGSGCVSARRGSRCRQGGGQRYLPPPALPAALARPRPGPVPGAATNPRRQWPPGLGTSSCLRSQTRNLQLALKPWAARGPLQESVPSPRGVHGRGTPNATSERVRAKAFE